MKPHVKLSAHLQIKVHVWEKQLISYILSVMFAFLFLSACEHSAASLVTFFLCDTIRIVIPRLLRACIMRSLMETANCACQNKFFNGIKSHCFSTWLRQPYQWFQACSSSLHCFYSCYNCEQVQSIPSQCCIIWWLFIICISCLLHSLKCVVLNEMDTFILKYMYKHTTNTNKHTNVYTLPMDSIKSHIFVGLYAWLLQQAKGVHWNYKHDRGPKLAIRGRK